MSVPVEGIGGGRSRAARAALAASLLLVVCAGAAAARLWPEGTAGLVGRCAAAARDFGLTGWSAAFLGQLLIALCGILPASMGALTAGAAFGAGEGFAVSGSATLVAAVVGFLLSRMVFRPLFSDALARRPKIRRLDAAVAQDGWRLVALLRISPVMPFAMTSYALGLTSLGLRDYVLGSLAALPALLGYVVLGALTSAGLASMAAGEARPLNLALLALAVGATALLTLRLARIVRRVLRLPDEPAAELAGTVPCRP